ncbi:hypothetical protein GH714_014094 [Hevea brasiliensis]|uniref:Uncharacterized protein n=1 Tax=Hevea brasiliensis TaxID=3981 RepID=A0A6A6KNF5_HEVBR|nr:hypothetical protein GH714_014094 [Hevea brasiliensis]
MCGSKSFFSHLNEDFHSTVRFGDCSTVNVLGKGDVKIRTKNGFVETIANVLYVPNLKSNLLSAGQLQEKGYVITFKNGACEIYDPKRGAIAIVPMNSNRLFPLKIESIHSCLMVEVKDPSWLWHFRYGHLSFGGLKTLQQKNMQPTPIIFDKEVEEEVQPTESSSNIAPTGEETPTSSEILPTITSAQAESAESTRTRKRPALMKDYEVTGVNFNEDLVSQIVIL